jgi:hypothetical protein
MALNESVPIDVQQMFDECIAAVKDFPRLFDSDIEYRDAILSTPMEF